MLLFFRNREVYMLSRNQEHELIMKIIYSYLISETYYEDKDPRNIIEEIAETPYDEVPVFVKETVIKVFIHKNEIIEDIKPHLNKWKLDRMNKVVVAILLFIVAEARYIEGSFKPALIDVAINLSKKYCDDKDYKFVNAILDKMI